MVFPQTKLPGKPSWSYTQAGLYRWVGTGESRELVEVLDWAPVVSQYIVTKDSRGKITSARYTVEVGGHQDTISAEELRSGEGWERYPRAYGHHDKQVREALAIVVAHQAAKLPATVAAPYWDGDRMVMPHADLMPAGYAERLGAGLGEILPVAVDNPKLALIIGLSYGSPYVEPLGRQPFWTHLTGGAREGKSTGMWTAASLWGRPWPRGVILPWNTTTNGLPAALSELSILPAFLDDLHSAGFTPAQIQKLIFSTVEGNSRLRSTRGGRRKDSAPWYGVLFSSGNDSILGMLPKAEVAARVVEIPSPIVADAATSKRVKAWAKINYGTWEAVPIVTMRAAVDQAEALLRGEIEGGTEETIMENLALGVAGAGVVGGKPLADAALFAAREILGVLAVELAESGIKPAEKLLEAVRQAIVGRAAAFPSRTEYEAALTTERGPTRDVEGFWEPPIAYVLTGRMSGIAAAYGIADPRVALRELRAAGRLLTEASANQLRKRPRVAGRRVDTYAFRLEEEGTPTPSTNPPTTRDTRDTRETPGQEAWNPSLVDFADQGQGTLVPAQGHAETPGQTVSLDKVDRIAHGARSEAPGESSGPWTRAERRPVRSVSESAEAEDREEWREFSQVIRARWPEADSEDIARALKVFSVSLGGLRHIGSSAVAGQLLFSVLERKYGAIPELQAGGLEGLEEMRVARIWNYVDQAAPVERYPWVMGMDVNAQFLAVGGSVSLGTGYAEPWEGVTPPTAPRDVREYFKAPGYVQLAEDHKIGGAVLEAGVWIANPTASFLAERGRLAVEPTGWIWPEHRRWLQAWYKTVRPARESLIRRQDIPSRYALHALKAMYTAFLGGYLRSTTYNRTDTLRPDWADQLMSLARVNMLRALEKTKPGAFAMQTDTAYFLLADNQAVQGLQISDQAGKWKVSKVGATATRVQIRRGESWVETTLAEQVARGSVAGVRDVVSALDDLRRSVAA